jgi:S1-C subfamily serine protease
VLTNNHVIEGATSIAVQIGDNGRTYRAHVVGYDVTDDVAVIQLENASGLATIPTGDSSTLRVGDAVVAIGNALGASGPHAVTTGQVEALDQTITANGDELGSSETLHGLIQHDAGLQPGDSGGALVDSAGKVVGMNSAALASGRRFTTTPSTESYAIPIDHALSIAHQIINGKASADVHIGDRAILGVEIGQFDTSDGVPVAQVDDGSPAAKAGVQPGDAITAIDGNSVSSLDDLQAALGGHHPGDHVKLGWTSADGSTRSATVTLIAGPPA